MLESKARNSWVDPASFSTTEEFMHAYNSARGWAKAVSEILEMGSVMQQRAQDLQDKKKDKQVDKFKIGE